MMHIAPLSLSNVVITCENGTIGTTELFFPPIKHYTLFGANETEIGDWVDDLVSMGTFPCRIDLDVDSKTFGTGVSTPFNNRGVRKAIAVYVFSLLCLAAQDIWLRRHRD